MTEAPWLADHQTWAMSSHPLPLQILFWKTEVLRDTLPKFRCNNLRNATPCVMMGLWFVPDSSPTITAEHAATNVTTLHVSLQQPQQQSQSQPQWPPLLEVRKFNSLHTASIPPYQFWNSEFRNKQPAFIRFNFTLPWGANFAGKLPPQTVPGIMTPPPNVKLISNRKYSHNVG